MAIGKSRWRDRRAFTLVEVLIVVTILAILAGLVLPHYTRVSESARASSLLTDLQMIRRQLMIYHTEHNGQYPLLVNMWDGLTNQTDINGNPGNDYGPYLITTPVNHFTGASVCAADNSADWQYNEITGVLRAVVQANQIVELDLSPNDAVASP